MSVTFSSGISIDSGIRLVQPPALITISSQPTNNTANYGANATFGVTAAITRGAVLTYQWQYNQLGQGSWTNISGANSSTYTVNSVTTSANNDAYRVVLTGTLSANSVTSNTARLYVTPAVITINTQPSSNTVSEGQTSTFSVSASATLSATLSYQWQKNDGSYWTNVSGATSSSYTTGSLTNADDNGDVYRVYITATKGATPVISSNATLTVTATSVQNSIDVAYNNGFYGAGDGTQSYYNSGTSFGTVTSDVISSVAYYTGSEVGAKTVIELKDGTYSGFSVLNGAISGDGYTFDSPGDRRTFTIAGSNYVFQYDGLDAYFLNGTDPLGLQSAVGTNITALFDTSQQSTFGLGITPDYISYMGSSYYGANKNYNASYMSFGYLPIFGNITLVADYIDRLYYNGYYTAITMKPGSYMWGSPQKNLTVGSSGQIGSDTNGTSRYFKLGGTNQTFSYDSSSGNYTASGDVWNLNGSLGQTLSLEYDPSDQPSQGGGGGGGGAGATYVVNTDWMAPGPGGPPGLIAGGPQGGPYALTVISDRWINTSARDEILAMQSGAEFTVEMGPVTVTCTLTSGFTNYGSSSSATMTCSSDPYGTITSITLPSSGTEYSNLTFGSWGGGGGQSQLSFAIPNSDTASIAALSAIQSGATITVKQGSSSTTVTITSAFMTFPAGPNNTGFSAYTNENNSYFYLGFMQLTSIVA